MDEISPSRSWGTLICINRGGGRPCLFVAFDVVDPGKTSWAAKGTGFHAGFLEIGQQKADGGVTQEYPGRPGFVLMAEFARLGQFRVDEFVKRRRQVRAVAFQVEFEIEAQATDIPVGAVYETPLAVHSYELGMIEGWRAKIEIGRGVREKPQMRPHRPIEKYRIAMFGNKNVHPHTAQHRLHNRKLEPLLDQKIGRYDTDVLSGLGQCRSQDRLDLVYIRVRPRGDAAREGLADGSKRRPPRGLPLQIFAGRKRPVPREGGHDLAHHGAFHLEVNVLNRTGRRRFPGVLCADIHVAHETERAIHDQHFAVVAHVEKRHAPRDPGVKKTGRRDAGGFQSPQHFRPDIAAPHAVNQYAHLNAAPMRIHQRVHELPANGIHAEDVGGKDYAGSRLSHGGEHFGIGGLSAMQHGDIVIGCERGPGNTPADPGQRQDIGRALWFGDESAFFVQRAVNLFELQRTAGNPVDPKKIVEERPDEGRQLGDGNPTNSAAHVAFLQQHIRGHGAGADDKNACDTQEQELIWPRNLQEWESCGSNRPERHNKPRKGTKITLSRARREALRQIKALCAELHRFARGLEDGKMKDYPAIVSNISGNLKVLRADIGATMQGFSAMAQAALKPQSLDRKTKELIALAIGVATRCDGCIGFHAEALVKLGASREEVEETLSMAIYMGGGPALMYAADAISAYDQFRQLALAAPALAAG